MDAISTEKEVMLGIYALDEGGYKVCFAPAGKPRPTALGSSPGSGYILLGLGTAEEVVTKRLANWLSGKQCSLCS